MPDPRPRPKPERDSTVPLFQPGDDLVASDAETADLAPAEVLDETVATGEEETGAPEEEAPPPRKRGAGGYRLLEPLGRGGMGEVYLAFDPVLRRNVALKRLREDRSEDQDVLRRFTAEGRITAMLQHPAIVPVYEMTFDGANTYYTMRPIEGRTLAKLLDEIAEGRLDAETEWTVPRLVRLFLQAASAIAFAHSRHVLHRDLKPSNIMIGPFEEVLVLDWGVAKDLSGTVEEETPAPPGAAPLPRSRKAASGVVGTPGYMSPEQIRGEAPSEGADVFALGVILYEILALRLPWDGQSMDELLQGMEAGPPPCPTLVQPGRDIPPSLADVAQRAIRFALQERYATVNEFSHAVAQALEGRAAWSPITVEKGASEWIASRGRAERRGGELRLRPEAGQREFLVFHRYGFSGNVRVVFDMVLAKGRQEFAVILSAPEAVYSHEREGYTLSVTSLDRRVVSMLRGGRDVAGNRQPHFVSGRRYHVVVERRDARLSLEVDGQELYVYTDPIPLLGSRIGFVGHGPGVRLQNLRVYSHGMNARVSCLMVPDTLFNRQQYPLALLEYRRIARSLTGWREGRIAGFRAGLCLVEMAREEEDLLEREDLLVDASDAFDQLGATVATPLAPLGRAIVEGERGRTEEEASAIEEAFHKHMGAPNLPMVREWLLSRIHGLGGEDRRTLAALLPLALRYALTAWGRQSLLERVELIRGTWETPWFFTVREAGRAAEPATRAEACLFFGFWSGSARVMENAVNDLMGFGRLRGGHACDLVAGLIELGLVGKARSWLNFFTEEEEGADRFERPPDARALRLARVAVLAAEGEAADAGKLLSGMALPGMNRCVQFARHRLAWAAYRTGAKETALQVVAPLDRTDDFGHARTAWFRLLEGDPDGAEPHVRTLLEREEHHTGASHANLLHGALLLARGKRKAARDLFALFPDDPHPPTGTLAAYAATGRLGGGDLEAYKRNAFLWEIRQLNEHLAFLARLRGDEKAFRRYLGEIGSIRAGEPPVAPGEEDDSGPPADPLIQF